MLVLRTSNFQGATISKLSDRQFRDRNTLLSLLFTTKFSSARAYFKTSIFKHLFFLLFRMKDLKAEMYQMKQSQTRNSNSLNRTNQTKPGKKPTKMIVWLQNISRTGTIHPGIFLGRTLSADSVSPRATTIASREQY